MSSLFASLPQPIHSQSIEEEEEELTSVTISQSTSNLSLTTTTIPPYGSRNSWRPNTQADFKDGGSYPECPVAQFPLEMGRKNKVSLV